MAGPTIDQQLLLDAAAELLSALIDLRKASGGVILLLGTNVDVVPLIEARVRARVAIDKARGYWPNLGASD